ncbi:MAG TPA: hypothetical protein VND93_14030, partial [Myxococcales bacterium]|nr:hypothetical protein [Myxococcales bacterium]
IGFGQWGESFADQTAMWGSLKDRGRVDDLLKEIDGNHNQSNSLTRMGEAFAALTGQGTGVRDALQDKTMSTTSPEVHDRSEVLTGASYKIFQSVYQDQLAHGRSREDAMQVAGDVMGTMNLRATEHTPENQLTFEDVGKGWLKVDKEYFHGKYHDVIANELKRREVFTDQSVKDFDAHEAALPKLSMGIHKNDDALNSLINKNLGKLGIGPGFGLKVLSHELDDNGAQIVRVQLTDKSGKKAVDLDNHGVLTFRPDGSLMDWQSPVPKGATTADLAPVLAAARAAGLDQHGAPVGVRRGDDGQLTAAARAMPTGNMNSTVTTWSLANPDGQVHDITRIPDLDEMAAALPKGAVVLSPDEIANLSPEDLAAGDQPATGPKLDGTASLFVAPPPPPPAVPADTTTQGG